MSTLNVSKSTGIVKILSMLAVIAGALFLVIGVTMYAVTSTQLKAQQVTVADYDHRGDHKPNGAFTGKTVADPFTALAQITAIQHHMDQSSATATGGKADATTAVVTGGNAHLTYGTAPSITLLPDGTCKSAVNWTDPAGNGTFTCEAKGKPEVTGGINAAALPGLRTTLQSGSFLIASLYVSVLAFGVSALAAGLGVVLIILGFAVLKLTPAKVNASASQENLVSAAV